MDLIAKFRDLQNTEAHDLFDKISTLNLISIVHFNNYIELKCFLDKYSTVQGFSLVMVDHELIKKEVLEVSRLLINFTSSAISLKNSSRDILKLTDIISNEIKEKSEEMLELKITNNPVIKFVEDLRNILIHQSIMKIKFTCIFNRDVNKAGLSLSAKECMKYERFTKFSKKYIGDVKTESIYLSDFIDEYSLVVFEYQKWVLNSVYRVHKEKFVDYWNVREAVMHHWDGDIPINTFSH
jgi:hypothetical protein